MTDSTLVLPPGWRATDANDQPIPGAKLKFYSSGTTTPITVYSDNGLATALGSVVTCDSGGYPVSGGSTKTLVYTGSDDYKLVVTTSADVTVYSHDGIKGAVVVPPTGDTAAPATPVVSRTGNFSIGTDSAGTLYNVVATSTITATLPSAVSAGDGFRVGIRHNGTIYPSVIATVSSQTISRSGSTSVAWSLESNGETVWLVSDGANWLVDTYVPTSATNHLPYIRVASRLTTPPASATGGARYIITGTPTGAWSTFATGDVVEATGSGGWVRIGPADGWQAYVETENITTQYQDTAWVDWSNVAAPESVATLGAIIYDESAQGVYGGIATYDAWTQANLNSLTSDTIGVTIGTNTVTIPAGTYDIVAARVFFGTGLTRIRFKSTTTSTQIVSAPVWVNATASASLGGTEVIASGRLVLGAAETFQVDYYCVTSAHVTTGTTGLGRPQNITGYTERYGRLEIKSALVRQGPQGTQGIPGATGALPYLWSVSTSGDPGTGYVRVNNGILSAATELAVSETTTGGSPVGGYVAMWDESTQNLLKGFVHVYDAASPGTMVIYKITGAGTDNGAYWTFPVTSVGGAHASFTAGNTLGVHWTRTGDTGTSTNLAHTKTATDVTIESDTGTDTTIPRADGTNAGVMAAADFTRLYTNSREKLTSNRTYYVRPDGSDSNTGLENTSGGAFLTLQKAWNVAASLDFNGQTVTVSIAASSYPTTFTAGIAATASWVGGGSLVIQGATGTATDVVISTTTDAFSFQAPLSGVCHIKDLKITTATSGACIRHATQGQVRHQNVEFGSCVSYHLYGEVTGAYIFSANNYTISGGCIAHAYATDSSLVRQSGATITITGSPAFSLAFAAVLRTGVARFISSTFSGSATGVRYNASSNGVIDANGAGATYLPGGTSGTTATGGQYI